MRRGLQPGWIGMSKSCCFPLGNRIHELRNVTHAVHMDLIKSHIEEEPQAEPTAWQPAPST